VDVQDKTREPWAIIIEPNIEIGAAVVADIDSGILPNAHPIATTNVW
jgi:hypothetical protein